MAADVTAPEVTSTSTSMLLSSFARNIQVAFTGELQNSSLYMFDIWNYSFVYIPDVKY